MPRRRCREERDQYEVFPDHVDSQIVFNMLNIFRTFAKIIQQCAQICDSNQAQKKSPFSSDDCPRCCNQENAFRKAKNLSPKLLNEVE